jgi:hypothetical protein
MRQPADSEIRAAERARDHEPPARDLDRVDGEPDAVCLQRDFVIQNAHRTGVSSNRVGDESTACDRSFFRVRGADVEWEAIAARAAEPARARFPRHRMAPADRSGGP